MPFRCLFHVHTRRSYDSILSPAKIIAKARDLKIDVLVVTDHNTMEGARDVRALASGNPRIVVTAAEYQSEKGDIIGLFLKEEVRSRNSREIIEQIHAQGGLVVLPHPYKGHKLDDQLLESVDLIESYNARCSDTDNARAEQLARDWNRPFLAGADAHCHLELNAAVNVFLADPPEDESASRDDFVRAHRGVVKERVSPLCQPYSQLIKSIKKRDPRLFLYQSKRLALVLARGGIFPRAGQPENH